jgi:predicted RNA-binding Zn-ribbon protein involved in translation (DUF1610 family)
MSPEGPGVAFRPLEPEERAVRNTCPTCGDWHAA